MYPKKKKKERNRQIIIKYKNMRKLFSNKWSDFKKKSNESRLILISTNVRQRESAINFAGRVLKIHYTITRQFVKSINPYPFPIYPTDNDLKKIMVPSRFHDSTTPVSRGF